MLFGDTQSDRCSKCHELFLTEDLITWSAGAEEHIVCPEKSSEKLFLVEGR